MPRGARYGPALVATAQLRLTPLPAPPCPRCLPNLTPLPLPHPGMPHLLFRFASLRWDCTLGRTLPAAPRISGTPACATGFCMHLCYSYLHPMRAMPHAFVCTRLPLPRALPARTRHALCCTANLPLHYLAAILRLRARLRCRHALLKTTAQGSMHACSNCWRLCTAW